MGKSMVSCKISLKPIQSINFLGITNLIWMTIWMLTPKKVGKWMKGAYFVRWFICWKMVMFHIYCGWKKSCTTLDGWTPIDNGINHLSTGAGFLPSTVLLKVQGRASRLGFISKASHIVRNQSWIPKTRIFSTFGDEFLSSSQLFPSSHI